MPTSTFTHRRKRGTNKDEAKLPPKAKIKRIGRIRSKDLTSVSTTGVFQTTLACSRVYPIGCFILQRFAISLISHKRRSFLTLEKKLSFREGGKDPALRKKKPLRD